MTYYGRKEADPFYSTAAWRVVRELALQRDMGVCQECLKEYRSGLRDRPEAATMVHHIKPIRERWDLRLNLDNLESLCDMHHEKMHPERHGQKAEKQLPAGVRVVSIKG